MDVLPPLHIVLRYSLISLFVWKSLHWELDLSIPVEHLFTMQSVSLCVVFIFLSSVMASPQWSRGGEGNRGGSSSSSGNAQFGSSSASWATDLSSSSLVTKHKILIAHAVLASAAWAFFFPLGAIFLRLNIHHPIMLKLHIFFQIFAYLIYVAAASMGVWLVTYTSKYYDPWSDPHPIIGIVLLVLATIQPVSGWIHHRIYRARAIKLATTNRGPRPGRTMWGRAHLWLGRCLITLGIINGGLGLRLVESSPVQDKSLTRNAEVGYGIAAGFMWCLYVSITMIWEWMRSARKRKQQFDSPHMRRKGKSQSSSSGSSLRRIPRPVVDGGRSVSPGVS